MITTVTDRPSTPTAAHPATRSAGDHRQAIVTALHSEWIKLSTVRVYRAIVALILAGGVLTSLAVGAFVTDEVLVVAEVGFYWTSVSSMLAAIWGVLLFGSEVQHGTLAGAFTAQPARWVLVVAKVVTAGVSGLVVGAAGLAGGFGGGALAGLDAGDTSSLVSAIAWAALFTTLASMLGLGIGLIVRHGTAAVGGLLVWGFVVENLLGVFLPEQVARFLPFFAGNHLLAYTSDLDSPKALAIALTAPENALVFAGYTVFALALGTILLYRRDAD